LTYFEYSWSKSIHGDAPVSKVTHIIRQRSSSKKILYNKTVDERGFKKEKEAGKHLHSERHCNKI